MKSFLAILALVAVAAADVSQLRSADNAAVILKQDADVFPDQYQYVYETSNGINAQERGVLTNVGREDEGIAAEGAFSYPGDDGQIYSLTYTADQNGFQPQGAHLPVPPPIPEYIARAIAYNLANAKPDVQRP
ncbi:flexible cuticle protein 12-like [Maniola jurtina]|uniref:flexible cuticle protein 12-like n=1 Tax=Maniola jurtina TaxID=191418 RepID=UPI001E68ECA1|nr:flexible cuticle protein 12-like [Maniola jurtina]